MRDIGEDRRVVPSQNTENDFWWFKGLLFVAAVLVTLAHFGVQRSFALERAAVGERTLGEAVTHTKDTDRLRRLDYEQTKALELGRIEDYSKDDRTALSAIIEGLK